MFNGAGGESQWFVQSENRGPQVGEALGNQLAGVATNGFEFTQGQTYAAALSQGAGQGWRLLSSPREATYEELLGPIWTQGATGSDAPDFDQPNVFTYHETGYAALTDLTANIPGGSGFAVYVYDLDDIEDSESGNWPKILRLPAGGAYDGPVEPTVNQAPNGFSLVGNPYRFNIEFSGIDRTAVRNQVFVYDHTFTGPFEGDDSTEGSPAGGGWRSWNGTAGSLGGGRIAPFQAFFVRNEAVVVNAEISIPESAQTTGIAELKSYNDSPQLQLAARINNSLVSDTWFTFTNDGSTKQDEGDVTSLYPLDYRSFLTMFTERDGESLDIKNLHSELAEAVTVPLHVEAWEAVDGNYIPMSGDVELIWPVFENIPSDWNISLVDNLTGETVDLRSTHTYEFSLDATKIDRVLNYEFSLRSAEITAKSLARLSLVIEPMSTSLPVAGELPAEFALRQNYPNPFNPTTQISYDLPESADVRLEVFNVMGQRVATLVNATQNAGTHNLTFDASRLASGVYIYRLQAGSNVFTKKMTLVK